MSHLGHFCTLRPHNDRDPRGVGKGFPPPSGCKTEGRREEGRKGVREKERETVNIFVQRKNYLRQIGPQDLRHTEPCMDRQGGDD